MVDSNKRAKLIARALLNAQGAFNKTELAPNLAIDLIEAMGAAFFGYFYPSDKNFDGSLYFSDKKEKYRPCSFAADAENVIVKSFKKNEIINLPEYSEKHVDSIIYLKKYSGGSILSVPIQKTQTVGVLVFGKLPNSGGFSPEDVELVRIIADSLAMLLIRLRERELLVEEMDEITWRNKQLSILNNAGRAISSILEPNTLLKTLLDELYKAIPYDKGAAYIYSEFEDSFIDIIGRGLSEDELRLERAKADQSLAHQVAKDGIVYHSNDTSVLSDGGLAPNLAAKSLLIVPFGSKGRCYGTIALSSNNAGHFSESDSYLLQSFGDYAATAIENSRLFEGERKRSLQLSLINEVGKSAVFTLQQDELFYKIATAIKNKFHYYNVAIYKVDESTGELELVTSVGGYENSVPLGTVYKPGSGSIGKSARDKTPILINNVERSDNYTRLQKSEDNTKSELSIPIIMKGKSFGVISIQSRRLNAFEQADLTALETLADHISNTLENAKLYEGAHKRAAEMALINEIGRNILGEVGSSELLQTIVSLINAKFDFFNTTLYLLKTGTPSNVQLAACAGAYSKLVSVGQFWRKGEGFIGRAIESGEIIFSNNANEDPRFSENPIPEITVSEVALPIKIGGNVIALMDVQQNRKNAFSERDIETLRILSDQIAIAIHNSHLFIQERKAAKDAETLLKVNKIISQTLDLEEALDDLVTETRNALGYSFTGVATLDSSGGFRGYKSFSGLDKTLESELKSGKREFFKPSFFSGPIDLLRPFFTNDIENIDGFPPDIKEVYGITSIAITPISRKGRLLGVLFGVWNNQEIVIEKTSINLLRGISHQASIAIENLTYVNELSEHSEYLLLLSSIAADASQLSSIQRLLDNAIERILKFVDFDAGLITLIDQKNARPGALAAINISDVIIAEAMKRSDRIIEEITTAKGEEPAYFTVTPDTHVLFEVIPSYLKHRALIECNLITKSDLIGKVYLFSKANNKEIDKSRLDLLNAIIDQLTIFIENTFLFEQTNKQMNELMTLLQTSKHLSSSLDPEEIIYNIAKEVKDLIKADDCTVFLVDSSGEYLEPIVSLTKYPEEVMKMRLVIGEGVTGYVAKTGIAEYVNEIDTRAVHVPGTPDEESALLSVPLISREEVIGVMTSTRYDGGFSDWDLNLVSLFTTQVAGLIENARLIDRILSTMTVAEEHRRKLNSIFSSISDGMIVADTDMKIIEVNRAAEILLGASEDDLINANITDYISDDKFSEICNELATGSLEAGPKEVEINWRETGGRLKYYLINIDILRSAQGENIGLISTLRDITKVKELDILKENFIANISHELRTPLTSIIGSAELVIEETDNNLPHYQFVRIIEKEAHRLRSLVDSILDFSLLETGSLELHPEFINLNYLCEELVYRYHPIAEDKGVTIYFNPYVNLKMVKIDQRLIESAIANLIKNGIQFNEEGGWVKLATEQDDSWIKIKVDDNGYGIPQERLKNIFEKFYQIDGSSTREVGGTGLGLTLVKESIEAHGGRIEVKSEPDAGTHFTIYLPKEGLSGQHDAEMTVKKPSE